MGPGTYRSLWGWSNGGFVNFWADQNWPNWNAVTTSIAANTFYFNNDPNSSSSECYKINARGDILDSKVTISQPSTKGAKTITFTSK